MDVHAISTSIPARLLAEMLIQRAVIANDDGSSSPFPSDARYIRSYYDPEVDALILFFEHPTFYRVYEGAHVPRVQLLIVPTPTIVGYLE